MGKEQIVKKSGAAKRMKKKAAIRGGVKGSRRTGVSRAKGKKRP